MNFKDYNDFYLIYLIKEMRSEVALSLMFEKYTIFIRKKISSFKIKERDRDDFLQEGLIHLNKSIYSFDDVKYRKTFFKFFDFVLTRRFITLKNEVIRKNYYLIEEYAEEADSRTDILMENVREYNLIERLKEFTTKIEREIYVSYFIENLSIDEIRKRFNYEKKAIYNAITRIKVKLKEMKEP